MLIAGMPVQLLGPRAGFCGRPGPGSSLRLCCSDWRAARAGMAFFRDALANRHRIGPWLDAAIFQRAKIGAVFDLPARVSWAVWKRACQRPQARPALKARILRSAVRGAAAAAGLQTFSKRQAIGLWPRRCYLLRGLR